LHAFEAINAIYFHSQFLPPQAFFAETTLRTFRLKGLVSVLRIPIANYLDWLLQGAKAKW
jgi:hypothetical protein